MAKIQTSPGANWVETPNNIPHFINSFVGRESELAQLQTLIVSENCHLLTITGIGGSGKTRLALEVAGLVLDEFNDGVWLIDLAPLSDPQEVIQTTAQAIGLPETRIANPLSNLQNYLKSKKVLLILDNCEHLIDESARLADVLLKSCPNLCILATSRERLGIDGELILHLPPLTLPSQDSPSSPDALANSEAVQLFVQRARAVQPGFELGFENAEAVAQICLQLDGLPLALELAAARLSGLGIVQVAARLSDRFKLLSNQNRLALPRQHTIQALLDWSYNLLTEREMIIFRRLAVFNGSASLEAIEQVCAGVYQLSSGAGILESSEIFELLSGLVNKSLVQAEPDATQVGVMRYRLLETVRQYAYQKLIEAGDLETSQVQRNLLDWTLSLALAARPHLEGPEQAHWFQLLQKEHYHFRTALNWALNTGAKGEKELNQAVQLAVALGYYWQRHGHFIEGSQWFLAILAHSAVEKLPVEMRSEVLDWAGALFNTLDAGQARTLHLQRLKLSIEQGDIAGQVRALGELGWMAFYQMENEEANRYALQALALTDRIDDRRVRINTLFLRSITAEKLGEYEVAAQAGEECLVFWREIGDTGSIISALNHLAVIATQRREFVKARTYLLESIELQREIDSPLSKWICLKGVISLLLAYPAFTGTEPIHFQAILSDSARWIGAVEQMFSRLGGTPPPMTWQVFSDLVKAVSAQMDEATFNLAREEGHQLSLSEVLVEAKAMLESTIKDVLKASDSVSPASEVVGEKAFSPLTSRELEVLRLVAKGLTNAEVGQELSVTSRTVNAHLTSIYSKLGLVSRSGAIRYAVENKLA